ncbi:hypothetical protein K788_00020775 [Paraburkholderia caribensis MBA4]|uniref:Uncharacterized protein n=1 Tax=Paraburkholderia caribensis MBA4 TaxID=1323664 RepID=A0A0P0R502_9BURK|nr:hypothetical protein K788_00020775 [Paraburkholderia caribensis MBA4]
MRDTLAKRGGEGSVRNDQNACHVSLAAENRPKIAAVLPSHCLAAETTAQTRRTAQQAIELA